MTRLVRVINRPVRIPAAAVLLLALSAFLGNAAQWEERDDLKAAASLNNAEAECRSRISGYVEGLTILSDIALGDGLLDRVGRQDDAAFESARKQYQDTIRRLNTARPYRERATEICSQDPHFDPEQIPKEP